MRFRQQRNKPPTTTTAITYAHTDFVCTFWPKRNKTRFTAIVCNIAAAMLHLSLFNREHFDQMQSVIFQFPRKIKCNK